MIWLLAACNPLPVVPPADGGLVLEQIRAPGPSPGEATLVLGPDGTTVLIDIGNDSHDGEVRDAVRHHTGEESVDWVVLTHLHADHMGGFDQLFDDVLIRRGVVLRGGEVGDGSSEVARMEAKIADLGVATTRLCATDPCTDLPFAIDLGEGATLTVALANGFTEDGRADVEIDPDTDDGENALSLGGFVAWGDFAYVFAGDIGGGGKGTPDVESWVVDHSASWPPNAEVLHLNHHGISSSTNNAWIGRWFDGGLCNALVGANVGYVDAPDEDILDRLQPALRGGMVWASDTGSFAGSHPVLVDREQAVVVTVSDDATYAIQTRNGSAYHAGSTGYSNP